MAVCMCVNPVLYASSKMDFKGEANGFHAIHTVNEATE